MGLTVTEADRDEIKQAAAGGDKTAQALLAKLEPTQAPKEPAEPKGEDAPAPEEKPEDKVEPEARDHKPEPEPEEKTQEAVDQGRKAPEPKTRENMHPATRRIVERETRRMRESFERQQAEIQELKQLLMDQAKGKTPEPKEASEEDALAALLSKPTEFLTAREKALVDRLEKRIDERLNAFPALVQKQSNQREALKTINSIEGLDLKNPDDRERLVSLIQEKTGMDDDIQADLFDRDPMAYARLAVKHLKEAAALSEKVKADKKAAASSASVAGKMGPSAPVSLESLNAAFAKAKTREEMDRIWKQMEELLDKK